ncbi:hypothetical protein [Spirosoma aerolatum]|uniref:hypothetical protein n=1 Tax=Spirosoma aerolatum TaxID=1211326 RepID=UPI0009AC0F8E|nr:hypothetical protein [Spirosoma aerolatum]
MKQTGLTAANPMATKFPINAPAGVEDQRFQPLHEAISSHATFLKIPRLFAAVVEDGRVGFLHTEGFADMEKKRPSGVTISSP